MGISYGLVQTALGYAAVAGSPRGLLRLVIAQPSPGAALAELRRCLGEELEASAAYDDLLERLRRYAEGQPLAFPDPLDWSRATLFQRRVWEATRRLPWGHVCSYGQLARWAGTPSAARAVGQALHANPLPIIVPCHRVVDSRGQLTGFGGGLALKRTLLRLEGISCSEEAVAPHHLAEV